MNLHIGCSGWVYPNWKGMFYPEDLPQKDWLYYYIKHFDSLEINSTFYHVPRVSTVNKWYMQAIKDFQYTIKINRLITHLRRFKNPQPELQEFYQLGALLNEKLGTFLFQLPPSFTYTPENLQNILNNLDKRYRNVIEFRHLSWWDEEVYEILQKHNIIFCSVSAPNLPEKVINLNDTIYLRFHGDPWYKGVYTEGELKAWAAKIKESSAKDVWVYFNNTANGEAPFNALLLKKFLS